MATKRRKPNDGGISIAALLISLAALLISFLTFYFSHLHEEDNISIIIDGVHDVSIEEEHVKLLGSVSVLFVNSGNRPAGIHGAYLRVSDQPLVRDRMPRRIEDASCHAEQTVDVDFDFEAFVIAPSDIVVRTRGLRTATVKKRRQIFQTQTADGFAHLIQRDWIANTSESRDVTVCLTVLLSTPGSAVVVALLPLTHTSPTGDTSESFTFTVRPITLFRRTSNVISGLFIDRGVGGSAFALWDLMREGSWPFNAPNPKH